MCCPPPPPPLPTDPLPRVSFSFPALTSMHPSFPDCNLTLHVQQVQKDHHVLRHTEVVPRRSSVVQTFELTLPQQLLRQLLQQLTQGWMTGRGPMSFGRATPSAISGVILRPPRLTANAANTQASHCPPPAASAVPSSDQCKPIIIATTGGGRIGP